MSRKRGTGPVRLAIGGAAGRMGQSLLRVSAEHPDTEVVAALEHASSPALGEDSGLLAGIGGNGVKVTDGLPQQENGPDVLIEFTTPEATLAHVRLCRQRGLAMVIGTTGLNEEQKRAIAQAAVEIPIVMAPNMSVGVNLMFALMRTTARVLREDYDVEIIEAHHRHKVDAPSGTALRLGEIAAEELGRSLAVDAVYGRQGQVGARDKNSIGFATIRGGDIVGDHTALFAGNGERVEISHRASSRQTFAGGALRAAIWLMDQPPGLYDMQDVLGLN